MDLVDFGFRVLLNLTDFSGVDRPEKSPEETETLIKLIKDICFWSYFSTFN